MKRTNNMTGIRRRHEAGQGAVTYALLLLMVAVIGAVMLTVLGNTTADAVEEVNCGLDGNVEDCDTQEQQDDDEEEREDPCPNIQIISRQFRCKENERMQVVVDVKQCENVVAIASTLPGLNRVVKPTKIIFRRTWGFNNAVSLSYCQAGGANLSDTTATISFDHDGTGEFVTTRTFTISRP